MMLSWRLKLREAEESLKQGRLDAAERLVRQHQLDRYRPGQRLAGRLACLFAERGCEMAARGAIEDAWQDLARAKSLDAAPDVVSRTEKQIVAAGVAKAREFLQADAADRARSWLADLELFGISDPRLDAYRRAAESLQAAESLARCGRFVDAEDQIDAAGELAPDVLAIPRRLKAVRDQAAECRRMTGQLRGLITSEEWEQALALADQILELVPQYKVARDARRRAVDQMCEINAAVPLAVAPITLSAGFEHPRETGQDVDSPATSDIESCGENAEDCGPTLPLNSRDAAEMNRFILWVDGVGGYLTCLDSALTVGQAVPDNDVDIPIQGDISGKHATIKRVGDEYLVEPITRLSVNGRRISEPFGLTDGDEIRLGESVALRFRRPHALSASARLDFVTRHRTYPWADGVILMAESCVLGPNRRNHVYCRDWRDDVVLFRQDNDLYCRAMESLEIDGRHHDSSGRVTTGSRIAGEDFSMTLERA